MVIHISTYKILYIALLEPHHHRGPLEGTQFMDLCGIKIIDELPSNKYHLVWSLAMILVFYIDTLWLSFEHSIISFRKSKCERGYKQTFSNLRICIFMREKIFFFFLADR